MSLWVITHNGNIMGIMDIIHTRMCGDMITHNVQVYQVLHTLYTCAHPLIPLEQGFGGMILEWVRISGHISSSDYTRG